jgi:hypothetical protein
MRAKKLLGILCLPGLDGTVAIAAASGLFKTENALMLAIFFIAGPASIITASLLQGGLLERFSAALLAGLIATIIICIAATLGPVLLEFVNIKILKFIGGIAILSIGLLIMGVKIPAKLPTAIMIIGLLASFLSR